MFAEDRPQTTKVFLYLRKSTEESSERQIRSIADQRSDCERIAERFWLEIVAEFTESKSARKPHQRKVFKELLKSLSYKNPAKRTADGLLAWHPNRLSRNALEAGMLVQMLDDGLIKDMFFASYSFHNDTSGKEHLAIEFARAKGYTDQLSDVVSRGIKSREATGAMMYPVKYGYVKKREHEKAEKCSLFPIPHETQFKIVQRAFELALAKRWTRVIIEYLKDEFGATGERIPSLPSLDRMLRDPFYKGLWTVLSWTKQERVTDLRKITLPDGTRFCKAISEEDFAKVQEIRSGKKATWAVRRRSNPLPRLVSCESCGRNMYATYRKVTRAWGYKEEQLGYECQTKGCVQSRFKADVLINYVAEGIRQRTTEFSKRQYQQYVLALNIFLKDKREEQQSERGRIQKACRDLTKQKNALIETKADLIRQGAYDDESRKYFDAQILELGERLENLAEQKSGLKGNHDAKLLSFVQFLELSQNLHHYWLAGDYNQKEQISKNLLLNLMVSGSEISSGSWLPPFDLSKKWPNFSFGRGQEKDLEPKNLEIKTHLLAVWDWYSSAENTDTVSRWFSLFVTFRADIEPKYALCRDIGKISGTKVY